MLIAFSFSECSNETLILLVEQIAGGTNGVARSFAGESLMDLFLEAVNNSLLVAAEGLHGELPGMACRPRDLLR